MNPFEMMLSSYYLFMKKLKGPSTITDLRKHTQNTGMGFLLVLIEKKDVTFGLFFEDPCLDVEHNEDPSFKSYFQVVVGTKLQFVIGVSITYFDVDPTVRYMYKLLIISKI